MIPRSKVKNSAKAVQQNTSHEFLTRTRKVSDRSTNVSALPKQNVYSGDEQPAASNERFISAILHLLRPQRDNLNPSFSFPHATCSCKKKLAHPLRLLRVRKLRNFPTENLLRPNGGVRVSLLSGRISRLVEPSVNSVAVARTPAASANDSDKSASGKASTPSSRGP